MNPAKIIASYLPRRLAGEFFYIWVKVLSKDLITEMT